MTGNWKLETGNYLTQSPEETFDLAYKIGESLTTFTVFLLEGELGTGKTVFAKGLAAGLEIDTADVNSPTFTLVNKHEGRLRMYHLDLYRIESGWSDLHSLGLEEILDDKDSVVVVEWPERLGAFKIEDSIQVRIEDMGGDTRRITIAEG